MAEDAEGCTGLAMGAINSQATRDNTEIRLYLTFPCRSSHLILSAEKVWLDSTANQPPPGSAERTAG